MRKRRGKDKNINQWNREQKSVSTVNKAKVDSFKRLIRKQISDWTR